MKKLLSKIEIIKLRDKLDKDPYSTEVTDIPNGNKIAVTRKGMKKPLVEMDIVSMKDETDYYVTYSKSRIGGVLRIGKLLYYLAMDLIFPKYLRPDSAGFSDKAKRVWDTLEKTEYVEVEDTSGKDVLYNIEEDDDDDDDNYSDKRYRFTFKNNKK